MFSKSTQYGIRAVLLLSQSKTSQTLKVDEIAYSLNLPKAFLSKILQQLSRSNVVSSSKGRGGGFFLSQTNGKRTLMDVVICLEGVNIFDKCILGLENCNNLNPCHLHDNYLEFKWSLEKAIKDVTIKDLFP